MEPAEMNTIPNGKGHGAGEVTAIKSQSEDAAHTDRTPGNVEANLAESSEFLSNADDKKTPHFTDFEGKTSFGMSVFNLGNAIMGSGILGLAYAMANTGIVLFVILLTVIAGLSAYSIHLLLKSSGVVGIRAYEQLGFRAFGTPGKMAAGIAITLQNIGGEIVERYWYLNGNYLVVIVSCSVILPLALMKQLGKSFLVSQPMQDLLIIQSLVSLQVIYKKFQVKCPFAEFSHNNTVTSVNTSVAANAGGVQMTPGGDPACIPRLFNLNSQTAYTVPILAFAFVCHPEVLPIYTELRNPTKTKMQHVSNISIGVMYIMYLLAALFGYLTFVDKVEAELLHTYSRIDPYDTLILCVRVAVLTAVTLTVPIVLFPVRRAIQQLFFPNKTFWWPRHIAIAVTLLSLINLLVIFAPNILGIFGVIGATSAPCLIFIFPAVFYIRIVPKEEEPLRSAPKIIAACFALLGVLFMIMSLSFIIIDWTSGTSKGSNH
uniref:Solute carrier family 38 member 3a n=1 Tax=Cyprinus carpio TaxID=7962 RepID=A0A8C1MZ16_CYPCA